MNKWYSCIVFCAAIFYLFWTIFSCGMGSDNVKKFGGEYETVVEQIKMEMLIQ